MHVSSAKFILLLLYHTFLVDYVGSAHSTRHFCTKDSQVGLYDVNAFFTNRVRELLKAVIRTFRGFIVLTCGHAVWYL